MKLSRVRGIVILVVFFTVSGTVSVLQTWAQQREGTSVQQSSEGRVPAGAVEPSWAGSSGEWRESGGRLSEKYKLLEAKLNKQKEQMDELREQYKRLKLSSRVRWFLIGSAVFLAGWIIGFTVRKKPPKYSLET